MLRRQPSPPSAPALLLQLLTPVVEGILQADMQRFADYAVKHMASTKA